MSWSRGAFLTFAFVLGLGTACDGTKVLLPDPPGGADGGRDTGSEVGAATPDMAGADSVVPADSGPDAPCAFPLEAGTMPFGGCPAQFTDRAWTQSVCPFSFAMVWEQTCAGYSSRQLDLGTHGWTCYYEPTTGALVAGRFSDDVPSFCGMTSSVVTYGAIPAAGTCTSPQLVTDGCSAADGGADSI